MSEEKSTTMRAVIYDAYGAPDKNLQLRDDVPVPQPKEGQVQIKVKSASINPIDWKISEGHVKGSFPISLPRIFGFDVSGTVSAVGADVQDFKVGDEVYGNGSVPSTGSFAEYDVVNAFAIAKKPQSLSFDDASAVPLAFLTAYQSLVDHGGLKAGYKVLVLGGSGGVGSAGVQIAKASNAWVAATTSTANVQLVQSLGADQPIDYKTSQWEEELKGQNLDLVFDSIGENGSFEKAQLVLKKGGIFVTCAHWGDKSTEDFKAVSCMLDIKKNTSQLPVLNEWFDQGKLRTVIDKKYGFTLPEVVSLVQYSISGRSKGKLVLTVQ